MFADFDLRMSLFTFEIAKQGVALSAKFRTGALPHPSLVLLLYISLLISILCDEYMPHSHAQTLLWGPSPPTSLPPFYKPL